MAGSSSSFIPKNPVSSVKKKRPVRRLYIITYMIYTLFVGALIVAGGTAFYKFTQDQTLVSQQRQLQEQREQFDTQALTRLAELDARLERAAALLEGYNSVASLFNAIERVTVASVTMQGFSYQKDQSGGFTLNLLADNPDFSVALFQREELHKSEVFENAAITDIAYITRQPIQDEEDNQLDNFSEDIEGVAFTVVNNLAPGALPFQRTQQPLPVAATSEIDSDTGANEVDDVISDGSVTGAGQ